MNIYYDKDADLAIIKGKQVAVIGYGSQGHAHANNLKDSGVDVCVGLREGSSSIEKAKSAGLEVKSISEAVSSADVIMLLAPDEYQSVLYKNEIEPNIKNGATLAFAHGFNIHFKQIIPRNDLDVIMIAPKGPGHLVRATYVSGGGVPSLIAIFQDASGHAKELSLSYASANGGGRAAIIETTFKEETETDLFGEQIILTGGIPKLIQLSFKVLLEEGYSPVTAWFVCYYELKTIVDMFHSKGFEFMNSAISDTAEYGGITRGKRIINEHVEDEMRKALKEIQSGSFHKEWKKEAEDGFPTLSKLRKEEKYLPIEKIGTKILKELFGEK